MSSSQDAHITTVICDFYGTIVDMQEGLTKAVAPYLQSKGYTASPASRIVTWWRRTHFENSMIDALLHRAHTSYRRIGQEALAHVLSRAGIDHSSDEVARLVSHIGRLDTFPEVPNALRTLKAHGMRLVVLSNGDPDMLADGVPYSGTEHLWDRVISVAETGSFKPHAATYATAAQLLGLQPREVLFVANHEFDCVGAKAAGMRAAFVNRRQRPFSNPRYLPDLTVTDFRELAATVTTHFPAGRT